MIAVHDQSRFGMPLEQSDPSDTPLSVRRRRSFALLIGVTVVVMVFALLVIAWMYVLFPIRV